MCGLDDELNADGFCWPQWQTILRSLHGKMCTEFVACLQVAVGIGRRTQWSKLEGTSDCLESYLNGPKMGNPNDPLVSPFTMTSFGWFWGPPRNTAATAASPSSHFDRYGTVGLDCNPRWGEDHDQLNICKLVTSKCPVWTSDVSFPEISRTSWTAGLMCWFLEPQPETCCQIGSDSSMPSTIQPPFCPKAYSI